MKRKIFELIDGREVHLSSGVTYIAAEDMATLLDSQELITTVQQDARTYKASCVQRCEEEKDQARKEGFAQGYDTFIKHINLLEQEIAAVEERMQQHVLPLAVAVAKKMVMAELTLRPEVILDMLKGSIKSIAQHKRVIIYVNEADFAYLESEKAQLKQLFEELESLSLRTRSDVAAGEFVIETEIGIINAHLQDRWNAIEHALQSALTVIKESS